MPFDSNGFGAGRSIFSESENRDHLPTWTAASDHAEPHEDYHDQFYRVSHVDSHERVALTDGDSSRHDLTRHQRLHRAASNVDRDEVLQMQKRISMLERKLASSANNRTVNHKSHFSTVERDPSQAIDEAYESNVRDGTEQQRFLPEIAKRDIAEFTNKYEDDREEYAMELLVRDTDLLCLTEVSRPNGKSAQRRKPDLPFAGHQDLFLSPTDRTSNVVPARVRINSPWILAMLANIDPEIDPAVPLVLLRPWKLLAHHEQKIRNHIRNIKQEGHSKARSLNEDNVISGMNGFSSASKQNIAPTNGVHCEEEMEHLQCLLTFIDDYVKPRREQFEGTKTTKVKFKDLFYLFKPGDDVYIPIKVRGRLLKTDAASWGAEAFQGRYERMWRVTATTGGYWNLPSDRALDTKLKAIPFKISCYYIDYDGKYFLPVTHTFSIMPFEGEEEITALDMFPVRYLTASSEIVDANSQQGQRVFESLSRRSAHYYYSGPTLVVHPCGCPIQDDSLNQEHIESEIIVDFATSLLKFPSWRPKASLWKPPVRSRRQEQFATRHWLNRSRQTPTGETYDKVYDDYAIDLERSVTFKEQELIFAPIPSGWLSNRSRVPEKDMSMLTNCGFAFVLRTRTFAPVSFWHLHEIKPQADSFNSLQLKDNTMKENIRALVRTHFRHEERTKTGRDLEYDIIRGKGKGLVILLHGAPGVGKSSTAESVAAANGRPLFQITCGDLGLTPKEVEKALKEIFRYAQMWGCILLLDECDIFLAARTRTEIQRNSLVSVFLRILEFYTGVLFLTTNRVGVLDDAVRSRITWTIYYPPLDEQQTREIWKGNLKLLAERNKDVEVESKGIMKFARDHFNNSTEAQPSWNGRQIQNAFKVAAALAEWDGMSEEERYSLDPKAREENSDIRIKLRRSHFERIEAGTQAFDRYIHAVTGTSEARRAWNLKERADEHRPEDDDADCALLSPPLEDLNRSPLSKPRHGRKSSITSSVQSKSTDTKIGHLTHSTRRSTSGQTSQYFLSIPEPNMVAHPAQNSRDRRSSGSMVADNAVQHAQKRRSEVGSAVKQKQSILSRASGKAPSVDMHDTSRERGRDGRRQRVDEQYMPTYNPSDEEEEEEELDSSTSEEGWDEEDT